MVARVQDAAAFRSEDVNINGTFPNWMTVFWLKVSAFLLSFVAILIRLYDTCASGNIKYMKGT